MRISYASKRTPYAPKEFDVPPATSVPATVRRPRPWSAAPLLVLVIAFLAFSLPPYLTGDPSQSRIPVTPAGGPGYYPMLVAHVVFGSVAILAACFQVWPWFRERLPDVHRRIGYAYVFAGVLPAGLLGLLIGARSPFGPTLRASNVVLAIVWLLVTVIGFRAARAYDLDAHRRWMTRSLVLTLSVITNRVWAVVWVIALSPQLETTFGGNQALMVQAIAGLSGWLGWVVPLVLTEWWLDARHPRTAVGQRAIPARAPVV
jgi:hypothetical protein